MKVQFNHQINLENEIIKKEKQEKNKQDTDNKIII